MSRSSNGEGNGLLSHPCGFDSCTRHFCFARSTEEDSSLLSRKCGFKSRAKHYGYVAKRLCSGLLTRQTQVRPLSCPLRSGDVTAAYRSSKPGVRVQSPFRASDQQKSWLPDGRRFESCCSLSLELRPMAGHLSYTQFTRVRIPQLRSCFSGVTGSAADL